MKIVPAAFVEFVVEKNFERDSIRLRCLRTGIEVEISHFQLEMVDEAPPKNLEHFAHWLKERFVPKIHLVKRK